MWDFWRRHKRKVYVTLGVFGSGYVLYRLYEAHRRRLSDLERELAAERENEQLIKAHVQDHFENIQKIADSTTLPHVMQYLSSRIAEELDLSPLTSRLMQGKGQPNTLTVAEKLDLWDRLKILSFAKLVLSFWAMTLLSLYIRVQVNILGRHLYIDTARDIGSSNLLDEADLIGRNDEQQFLATSDFLSQHELPTIVSTIQNAASEVLKGKQLKDVFDHPVLRETLMQMLDTFMSLGGPHSWTRYLMPKDPSMYEIPATPSGGDNEVPQYTKFGQLVAETHAVLSSAEFGNVLERSLKTVMDAVVEEIMVEVQPNERNVASGVPLAKLLPRVAQMGQTLLEEPRRNKFIQILQTVPEVELFFTLLYSSMPS